MNDRRVIRFKVSATMIARALGLPDEAKVIHVEAARFDGIIPLLGPPIEFYVESPDLPLIPEGQFIPEVVPTVEDTGALRRLIEAVEAALPELGRVVHNNTFEALKEALLDIKVVGARPRLKDWGIDE